MNLKTAMMVLIILLLIGSFAVCFHNVKADSSNQIVYPGGLTLYSPVNTTYYSNYLTLNLVFAEGLPCSLKYYIDGTYEEVVPLVANPSAGFQMITYETGLVPLPQLSEGSHCLKIYEECDLNGYGGALAPGAPFKETSPGSHNYIATWIDTVDFTIKSNAGMVVTISPTTAPKITNLLLENQTYSTTCIPLKFTVDTNVSHFAYSLDGKGNVTIFGNSTLTNLSIGTHDITIYAWNDHANIGSSQTLNFAVTNPSTAIVNKSESFSKALGTAAFVACSLSLILILLFYFKRIKQKSGRPSKSMTFGKLVYRKQSKSEFATKVYRKRRIRCLNFIGDFFNSCFNEFGYFLFTKIHFFFL